jgi:hypothetical protein
LSEDIRKSADRLNELLKWNMLNTIGI